MTPERPQLQFLVLLEHEVLKILREPLQGGRLREVQHESPFPCIHSG